MLEQRRKLPAWNEKENILDLLERCQVLVVSGMTGWVSVLIVPIHKDSDQENAITNKYNTIMWEY